MENGPGLKMYFLLKMGIFHCYVSLPEGKLFSESVFFSFPAVQVNQRAIFVCMCGTDINCEVLKL